MKSSHIDFIRPEVLNETRILSWFTYKNPSFTTHNQNIPGLNVGFNTKENQEALLLNYNELCREINTNRKDLALAHQVHKTEVKVVSTGGIYNETDAFVTAEPGIALGIQVADCGAVLLGDSKNQIIGAAHAGWRGAVGGIVPKTIECMITQGAELEEIKVFISPCLAKHNFEVGNAVASQFGEAFVNRKDYNKPHVDLKGFIKKQLIDSGLAPQHIETDERCTIDHDELFYSYRREKEKSGRMAGIVKLNKLK